MPRHRNWKVRGVTDPIDFSQEKAIFRVVLMLPSLVLLIACSNLANFALSRGIARRNELAVRQALGASRWQLVRGFLAEYGLLSLAGAAGGLAIADRLLVLVATAIEQTAGSLPQYRLDARIDGYVLAAVAGFALLSILVAGLLPALQLTRGLRASIDTDPSLTSTPRWRGRSNLIALQVSVSLALLLVSALCLRQIPKLKTAAASGMSLEQVAVVTIPHYGQLDRQPEATGMLDETVRRIGSLPTVASVSYASKRGYGEIARVGHESVALRNDRTQFKAPVMSVAPEYFTTVGIDIVSGRPFTQVDTPGSERTVVLSAAVSRVLFGSAQAVGRRVQLSNDVGAAWRNEPAIIVATVVGVSADTYERDGTPAQFIYRPFTQRASDTTEILARVDPEADPGDMSSQAREILRRVDPDVAVSFAGPADAAEFGDKAVLKIFVIWFGGLALLALGFAMSGLYGVLSHVVGLRTRELGVRAALGADRRRLVRLVLKDGARPVAEGTVIGLGIAAGVRLGMQPWFEDPVTAVDPVALVIALVPLTAAALLACYLPARRAATADPNLALKHL